MSVDLAYGRNRGPGRTVALVVTALLAVGAMVVTVGWSDARRWWDAQPRTAVVPDDDGVATIGDVAFRLSSFERLASIDTGFEIWQAPAGTQLWRVETEVVAQGEEASACDLELLTADGRVFTRSDQAPAADVASWSFYCGYDEEDGPTQIVDFLLPADAEPVQVRIYSQFDTLPRYWAFDVDA
ncbi:hypothetical protein Bcav_0461 [Beutenbergia cavernae DSM 12333]|uniref:DUF4352 domain-containing protein n=1 Tax=Beutenbergia cavernae (strain ATCC BAA-8 / DSM 12333 / CCUG 43141 / JCM 11478 / NBRC 16432 / NCIMB 13614 / HKI 0122) TaxID=471853 RepID=C5BX49_BEUC1|nr:hypothetical protein [Beutenbergia cavernae]ACQ78724.1 hypothetical protein Bcav_0461 [Beutenbergia cavernae DSM 12333]